MSSSLINRKQAKSRDATRTRPSQRLAAKCFHFLIYPISTVVLKRPFAAFSVSTGTKTMTPNMQTAWELSTMTPNVQTARDLSNHDT